MHECNANSNLNEKQCWSREIERINTKTMGLIGTCDYTNHLMERLKLASIKWFGKDVSILTLSKNVLKSNNFPFNKIPNEVISNLSRSKPKRAQSMRKTSQRYL